MTYIKKTYILLAILLSILISLVVITVWPNDSNDHHLKTSEDISKSKYKGIDIVTEIQEEAHYYSAVHYPVFEDKQLSATIKEVVSKEEANFLSEVAENKTYLLDRDWQAHLNFTFELYPVMDNIYSIVFDTSSYVAGANGKQQSTVFIVDLEENQFISGKDIIKTDQSSRDIIYQTLKTYFETSDEYKAMFFEEYLLKWINETNFSHVYLTKDDIIFKFAKYDVTAGAAGSPEVALAIEDYQGLLKDTWKERLRIEDPVDENDDTTSNTSNDNDSSTIEPTENDKVVALTFDDGPHPDHTFRALQLLDQYDMQATFFMLGSRIDFYPNLVKEVFSRGHEIGNHTWNHKQLTTISDGEVQEEINRVDQSLKNIIGEGSTVFRPPYGAINERVEQYVDVPTVLWTIDTLDWKTKNPEAIFAEIKQNLKPGAIILMHDIHGTTIDALELILPYLKEQGYTSVSVSTVRDRHDK